MIPRRAFLVPVGYTISSIFVLAFILIAILAAGPRACAETVLRGEGDAGQVERTP